MNSRLKNARIAGLLYLFFIIFSILADRFAVFVQSTTLQVIEKIQLNTELFTIGLVSNILSGVFFLLTAWALYRLLKEVNANYALLFLLLNLTGVAIQCLSVVFLFAGQELLSGTTALGLFDSKQIDFLSVFFIKFHQNGFLIAQIFYGLWLLPLGYLVIKSKFLPKVLGILLIVDFAAISLWFFQYFIFPQLSIVTDICLIISLIAEFGLTFWLLFKGVKKEYRKVVEG
ncbi:MAG: DUF4386 domain-containing protein [Clostridiales bacterium]|nr:DUF4386 domain-containing protein [Clostridiales bacterium]